MEIPARVVFTCGRAGRRPEVSYEGMDHIAITPNASIATDPTPIPTGTVILLNVPATTACKTVSSIAVAQDIGGRIKGPPY